MPRRPSSVQMLYPYQPCPTPEETRNPHHATRMRWLTGWSALSFIFLLLSPAGSGSSSQACSSSLHPEALRPPIPDHERHCRPRRGHPRHSALLIPPASMLDVKNSAGAELTDHVVVRWVQFPIPWRIWKTSILAPGHYHTSCLAHRVALLAGVANVIITLRPELRAGQLCGGGGGRRDGGGGGGGREGGCGGQ